MSSSRSMPSEHDRIRRGRSPADSPSVDLPFHVPIVAMSVKVPVDPMVYIETSFEPEFVT
jgi:hypothetical protein